MACLTTQYSANRAVREYTEEHYIPAAAAYRQRAADKGAVGVQVVDWLHALNQNWATLRFGEMKVISNKEMHLFKVEVYLGSLDPSSVQVELYANGANSGEPERQNMRRAQQLTEENSYMYSALVPATRPATDFTPRIFPRHNGIAVPLENSRILWQR
jgi:starch phosphorylase